MYWRMKFAWIVVVQKVKSPAPHTRLWDLHPLAESAWGNALGFNDGSGDGKRNER